MLRASCLVLTILGLFGESAFADAPPELGANAALKYWQAFATLPKLTDAEQHQLVERLTKPLDTQARQAVTDAEYALRMMHRGAALPRCDWGVGYEDGIYVRLPHVNAARALSTLACLRARVRFEEGHDAEAIDDVVAAMTLARHVSLDGGFIIVLVGYQVEHRAIETLALYLPKLGAATVKDLKARLDALPAGGTSAATMQFEEKSGLDWFVRSVRDAKDQPSLVALLATLSQAAEPEGRGRVALDSGQAMLAACGGTADGVLKLAEELRPLYAVMAKKLELPVDRFDKEFQREADKRAGNPVFKVFFPALPKCRQAQARIDVRRALLSAACSVQLDGQGALKNHPDPVGGGPFEYVPFEGGFELRSKLTGQDGKPVALGVGRHEK